MEQVFTLIPDATAFILHKWIDILPTDFLRYALGAGGTFLLVNVLLAGVLAGRKIRSVSPGGEQMRREFAISMRTVAIFALSGAMFIAGGLELGLISIDRSIETRGWLYFVFNVAVLIIAHDAWFYWTHRLIHHPRLFVMRTGSITNREIRRPLPHILST